MSAPLDVALAARVLAELRAQLCSTVSTGLRERWAPGGLFRAITLHQPWAWAIFHAGKTVENRTWSLARWATNKWIALHAGVRRAEEEESAESIRHNFGVEVPPPSRRGRGVVGLVKFGTPYKVRDSSPFYAGDGDGPGYSAARDNAPPVKGERLPNTAWECGPFCWPIVDRLALPESIPVQGAQGFWFVPREVTDQVLAQLAGAGAAAGAAP